MPNQGQQVGASAIPVSPTIAKEIVEALKSGDTQRYYTEIQKYGVEPRNVIDGLAYNQNLLFAVTAIKNEDQTEILEPHS